MRDYQQECIETIKNYFKEHDRQLIQLPTGAGKTWIFCKYLKENSHSALIVCPNCELQEQIIKTAERFQLPNVKNHLKQKGSFYVITTMALAFALKQDYLFDKHFDHVVIDEAHHAQAATYTQFLENCPYKFKLLGCTATPERRDKKGLLEIFGYLSYEKTLLELIETGFLADICAFKIITNEKISLRSNDFRNVELKKLDNDCRNFIIIKTFLENCVNKKTLIFCVNIEHSIKIAELLKQKGIRAHAVHGKMGYNERQEILLNFKNGTLQVLTNCQLLTEGFDEPTIENIIIARPTTSKTLYFQMIGRGVRKTKDKSYCCVYELADNNFKLCTFNVLAEYDPTFQRDYPNGIFLTKLNQELKQISFANPENIMTEIRKIELFVNRDKLNGNVRSLISLNLWEKNATDCQKKYLNDHEIEFDLDINFIEATFLKWKNELRKKYGSNN